jgi:hypothetical protein
MLRGLALAATGLAGIACILHVAACDDPVSHIFVGRFYVDGRDCLGTNATIDVVEGADPGDCAPVCLVKPDDDGGRSVYVSTMCAPYPPFYDAGGGDPGCPRALAALARGDTCLADGGSTQPPPADAGSD